MMSLLLNAVIWVTDASRKRSLGDDPASSLFFGGTLPSVLAYRNTVLEYCLALIYCYVFVRLLLSNSTGSKTTNVINMKVVLGATSCVGLFGAYLFTHISGWYKGIEVSVLLGLIVLCFFAFGFATIAVSKGVQLLGTSMFHRHPALKRPFQVVGNFLVANDVPADAPAHLSE